MLNYDISAYLAAQGWCELSLRAYTVNHTDGVRTFTRNSAKDIPAAFIDHNTLHYEASQIPGTVLEPGGLVPALIRCHVFRAHIDENGMREEGGGVIREYTQTPTPRSTDDYDIVFRPYITMRRGNGANYMLIPISSHMIITGAEELPDYSWNLTLQDELIVLDAHEFTPDQANNLRTNANNAFMLCGFNSTIQNASSIYNGSCYISKTMSSRQALSYILQASGMYGCMFNGNLYARLVQPASSVMTLDDDYVFDVKQLRNILNEGKIIAVRVYYDGEEHSTTKYPGRYICQNNPFIVEGNRYAVKQLLEQRLLTDSERTNTGTEITCLYMPTLEIGDMVYYYGHNLIISRIEWDGGAFCKLKCAEEDTSFR